MTRDNQIAYTTGPSGQMVIDWSVYRSDAESDLDFNRVEDRRDNRDPEEIGREILMRNGAIVADEPFPEQLVFAL